MLKQHPELVRVNSECLWNLRSIIVSNEQFVSYYGIIDISYHIKQNKKCIHRFKVAHWKCTYDWTSIADGYVSCICSS